MEGTMTHNNFWVKALAFYGTKIHHRGQWRVHALLRRVLGISVDADFEVLRSGLMWRLNPNNYVESDLFWLGSKDLWELYHAKRFLSPGCVIFDIGANFGYYSCVLGSTLNMNCTIYSFEPFPSNYERLIANISLNNMESCIHAYRLGLSDSEGTASMKSNPANTGAAYVDVRDGDTILTTIDHFSDKKAIKHIAFIKIDVEGFELFVLRGGEKTIKSSKPVILIELNPPTLMRLGLNPQDVVDKLTDYGYSLFVPNRQKLVKLVDLPRDVNYKDVFCVHPEGALREHN
jgi:FkbM family methyltransferase